MSDAEQELARRELRDCALRWIECGWRKPDREVFFALHGADFVDHSSGERAADRDGFWQGVIELFAAFPDFSAQGEDLAIDTVRGLVGIRWSATGTHRGTFSGIRPTSRTVHFTGIELIRIERGVIRDRWGEWNGSEITACLQSPES